MPCSHQTPVGPERQAIRHSRCCVPQMTQCRLPRLANFGAQSHCLHRRCLRFAVMVAQAPRKTRFQAGASLTRAGLDPQDLFGKFPSDSSHVISSPFPELCSAHATLSIHSIIAFPTPNNAVFATGGTYSRGEPPKVLKPGTVKVAAREGPTVCRTGRVSPAPSRRPGRTACCMWRSSFCRGGAQTSYRSSGRKPLRTN